MRSKPSRPGALRLVCLIEGGEPAEAVAWMDEFLRDFTDGSYEDENGEWVDVYQDESRRTAPGVKYVEEYRLSYDDLMLAAEEYLETGEFYCLPFVNPEYDDATVKQFWDRYEAITGIPVKDDGLFFRCAC